VIPVFAQPALADARKTGDLPLSHPTRAKYLDDDAEITMTARLKHIRTCANPFDNLAHVGDG
jgi:hypothetical protein